MDGSNEIHSLHKLRPFIRLLNAYDSDQFRHHNNCNYLKSAFYVFWTSVIAVANFFWFILIAWNLHENDYKWSKCVVSVPILISVLHIASTFIAMIAQNRNIIELFNQMQRIVNQRTLLSKIIIFYLFDWSNGYFRYLHPN